MGSNNDNEVTRAISTNLAPGLSTNIAHDGDVILIVGAEEVRFRIYSFVLRTASTVFDAMFGPNWKEGQALSAQNPPEIALEESDAEALRSILYILHHRSFEVSEILTPVQIFNIAVECDKYDLADALRYISAHWLKTTRGDCFLSMGNLMAAAYLFCNTNMFAAHTLELIMRCSEDYMKLLASVSIRQLLPIEVVCLLEQRRTAMKAELGRLIVDGSNAHICDCKGGTELESLTSRKEGFASLIARYSVAGILGYSIEDIIKSIKTIRQEEFECADWDGTMHKPASHEDSFAVDLEAIKKRTAICIDCANRADQCRFQHT